MMRTAEAFEDGTDAVFTLVYAEWCPHCKTVKPEFAKVVAASPMEIAGKKVRFEMLEEKADAAAISKLPRVEGYPTFFFTKKGGQPEEYRGARTPDAMKKFIEENL
jgi:thiol-disulfide isomerase/thioredoxin